MWTDPRGAEEDTEDLLLCDWLVGGFGVGLGCRGENGVNVDINEGDELRVDWGGRLTKLPKDPVLGAADTRSGTSLADAASISYTLPRVTMSHVSHLDGHFVLGERSAPKQLVDAVNGQEARDVGAKVVCDCDSDRVGCDHLCIDRE